MARKGATLMMWIKHLLNLRSWWYHPRCSGRVETAYLNEVIAFIQCLKDDRKTDFCGQKQQINGYDPVLNRW